MIVWICDRCGSSTRLATRNVVVHDETVEPPDGWRIEEKQSGNAGAMFCDACVSAGRLVDFRKERAARAKEAARKRRKKTG